MAYRISSYETNPRDLKDSLGATEHLDTGEVVSAAMALCEMVAVLQAKVAKLEAAEARNRQTADLASMLANGIKPD